jgi:hypothetical protein
MPTIYSAPGGVNSNSYETLAEANTYFDERMALATPWVASGDVAIRSLLMATRGLEVFANSMRMLVPAQGGIAAYYRTPPHWTGTPATATQRLSWPRIGMFDRNGNSIASDVIPQDLKDAQSEFAGQFLATDFTLNNDVIIQGLTSVRAGSVALAFKDQIFKQTVPDAVWSLLVPGWITDELVEPANPAFIEVGSRGSDPALNGWTW